MAVDAFTLEVDARPLKSKIDRMLAGRFSSRITAVMWNELTPFVVIRRKNNTEKGCATHYVDIELPSGIKLLHW